MDVRGLSFGFGSSLLFRDFSCRFVSGISILEGPSGCGKTTLLKLIAGLLLPVEVAALDAPADMRLVLQRDGLFPWQRLSRSLRLNTNTEAASETTQAIYAELVPLLNRRVYQLSFGERRLAELYRALLEPPQLLLLDEPLNFLDERRRGLAVDAMRAVASRSVVVVTSHYESDANALGGRVFRFGGSYPVAALEAIE